MTSPYRARLLRLALGMSLIRCQSTGQAVLRVDALNTVGRVDVLDEGNLVAGGGTLAGGDGGVGKEVLPDLVHVSMRRREIA